MPDGERVAANDDRNLQALCYVCNRGMDDSSMTDFRSSVKRMAEAIVLAEQRVHRLAHHQQALREAVSAQRRVGFEPTRPNDTALAIQTV